MSFEPSASLEMLRFRADLLRKVRRFFDERGFLEVETPILSADVVVDRHLDPFVTILAPDPRTPAAGQKLWLQTSPEFHMKRLLAAGAGPIYQLSRVFRNGEVGGRHNPEFAMLEWYEPGVDYQSGMAFLSELVDQLLGRGTADILSYRDAFKQFARIDPIAAATSAVAARAAELGVAAPKSLAADDRDGWLDLLLVERVEPKLGIDRPTIVCDYPASQAALAKLRVDVDGRQVAERFELYVNGIELANGYHELLDPQELRQRNRAANELRRADGKPTLPVESRLLAAMEQGLPPSVGVALGFDRLVMVASGASSLGEAIAFPIDRA